MSALVILAWVLAAIAIASASLTALALATWLRIDGRLDGRLDAPAGHARVRWTLLTVGFDVAARTFELRLGPWRLLRRGLEPSQRRAADVPARRRQGASRWRPRLGGVASSWRFYRRQLHFLLARLRFDMLRADVRVATPDPALTGVLYGAACSLVHPLAARWPRAELAVAPDFVDTVAAGHLALAVRVRIATLAIIGWRVFWYERTRAGTIPKPAAAQGGRSDGTQGTARGAGRPRA
jgi:hypothetical protein